MLNTVEDYLSKATKFLLALGCIIVLVQALWITYGVIVRYVFNNPSGTVTEATALLLVPVAFLGLSYGLQQDAYPKVTIFIDGLSAGKQLFFKLINQLVMTAIGIFLTASTYQGMIKSYTSGAASEILLWERFYFWIPVFLALLVFTMTIIVYLIKTVRSVIKG